MTAFSIRIQNLRPPGVVFERESWLLARQAGELTRRLNAGLTGQASTTRHSTKFLIERESFISGPTLEARRCHRASSTMAACSPW